MKPVRFVGDKLQAIRNLPVAAKNKAGYQLEDELATLAERIGMAVEMRIAHAAG
jgi:hypothetical protein